MTDRDLLQEEADFWREQHRELVDELGKIIRWVRDEETSTNLRALRYRYTAAQRPSPIEMKRVREFLENNKSKGK